MSTKSIVAGIVLAFVSFASAAIAAEPLVVKTNYPGFVHPAWVRLETCEVFADKVVITRSFGAQPPAGFVATETREVTVSDGIATVIDEARNEELGETPNLLCDGPSTYVAAGLGTDDTSDDLVIFSTGGCGSPRKERAGGNSKKLLDLVNVFCPRTHDYAGDN